MDVDGYECSKKQFSHLFWFVFAPCHVLFICADKNSEDDKKRGRSTDSDISQVRKDT